MKAVSYLLDKSIWTDKFKGNGAEYVVGGPSLDMVLTSYNQYTNQSNMYQAKATSTTGYKFSYDGGTTWKDYIQDSSKYLTKVDNLYRISSQSNALAYWCSSPSAYGTIYVMYVNYGGYVSYNLCSFTGNGFCPVAFKKLWLHLLRQSKRSFVKETSYII